jgi:hypothetical protein
MNANANSGSAFQSFSPIHIPTMQVAALNGATYTAEMELHIFGKSKFQVPEIPPNNLNTQKISPCSTKLEGALK